MGKTSLSVMIALALVLALSAAPHSKADDSSTIEDIISAAAPDQLPVADGNLADGVLTALIDENVKVDIPLDPDEVVVLDPDGEAPVVIDALPDSDFSVGEVLEGGSVLYSGDQSADLVVQPLMDEGVRFTVVLDGPDAPDKYDFTVAPEGGHLELVDGGVLVFDRDGNPIAGAADPWAMDADGNAVETWYETDGQTLVQVVDHVETQAYPIVADPVIQSKIIKEVKKEAWNSSKGGYEVRLTVTTYARLLWVTSSDSVYLTGLRDLQKYYPRSMKKATMEQQWNCHVVGLPATINIDLEGWRASKPRWAETEIWAAIKLAVKEVNPTKLARACNW